jgi:xylulokinase
VSATEATLVVTLDIGGSAAKASAYDAARKVCLGSTAVPYPPRAGQDDPGMFDPDGWWLAAVGALRNLRQLIGEPAGRYLAITVSAIRIPFVLLDAAGNAVMPGLLNRDRRATQQVAGLTAAIGSDELYGITGHWPAPEFGLPKLLWVRDHYPDAWRATQTVLQLHDWLVYRLSGVLASEWSSAAMSQMIDVRRGGWAAGLLAALSIPKSLLPELHPAGTLAGRLLPDVASASGFAAGTPVHIGGGDTHMSALSAQPEQQAPPAPSQVCPVVVAGTTAPALQAVPTSGLPSGPGALFPLLVSEHVVADMTALEANAGPTGTVADLLIGVDDQSGSALQRELERRGLALVNGNSDDELVVLSGNPFFGPDGWASVPPPTVVGLRDSHNGNDVHQACLRGTCYSIRSILDCLTQRSGVQPGPVVATGGMSRSAKWAQMLADITGEKVIAPPLDQIAGRAGALIVTGARAAPDAATQSRTFTPNSELAGRYAVGLAKYRELYQAAQFGSRRRLESNVRPR